MNLHRKPSEMTLQLLAVFCQDGAETNKSITKIVQKLNEFKKNSREFREKLNNFQSKTQWTGGPGHCLLDLCPKNG